MRAPGLRALLPGAVLLILVAGSCAGRELLDCRSVFPDLAAGATSPELQPSGSGFAQELARRMSWPAGRDAAASEPSAVLVAGRFVAELPETGAGRWQRAGDREVSLLAHIRESGAPDALVYAEPFSALGALRPSAELARFAMTVDPALLGERGSLAAAAIAWVEELVRVPEEVDALRRLAWMATTRTGGRGLGYTSRPHTFTGWKWIGRSRRGVLLRFARSHGEWAEQTPLSPEVHALLPRLVRRFPHLAWLAAPGIPDPGATGAGSPPNVPAYMVFGNALTDDGTGVHLAILCAQAPVCAPAGALAEFLTSLRPAEADDLERLAGASEAAGFEAFAAELGLIVAPATERLAPGKAPS